MKTIVLFLAVILYCQAVNCQEPKMVMDCGDSIYYTKKIPENLNNMYGKWGGAKEKDGYAVLGQDWKGVYRYPSIGFATNCVIEDITVIDWGLYCDKNGTLYTYNQNGLLFYIVVLISDVKKFEACNRFTKYVSIWNGNDKLYLGKDTRWEKQ